MTPNEIIKKQMTLNIKKVYDAYEETRCYLQGKLRSYDRSIETECLT